MEHTTKWAFKIEQILRGAKGRIKSTECKHVVQKEACMAHQKPARVGLASADRFVVRVREVLLDGGGGARGERNGGRLLQFNQACAAVQSN